MKKLFEKFFGGSKEVKTGVDLLGDVLQNIIDLSKLRLSFDFQKQEDGSYSVEMYGEDEEMLIAKDGMLLDAFQLYLKRVVQHQLPEEKFNFNIDCGSFRESSNQSLIELAEKLKDIAVNRGKPVYFRALPPRDRKVIHQYLAEDGRVKSRSVGDGLYKKIKIFPVKESQKKEDQQQQLQG